MPRWHFVCGKGGVGKTTCAAALALQTARHGRTLLISADPASSLSDVLGLRIGRRPRVVARNLAAADVDARAAVAAWLAPRRPLLARLALRGTYLDADDVARLLRLTLPGIDEAVSLFEISARSSGYASVVVDTAPTGHTLRLLGSSAVVARGARFLDALQERHRAVVAALRGWYAEDDADRLVDDLQREADALDAQLRDPARTQFTWVTLPEPMSLEETADALQQMARDGLRVSTLLVNRTTIPPPRGCGWCAARERFERRAMVPIAQRFAELAITRAPEMDVEPIGEPRLRAFARAWRSWRPLTTVPPLGARVQATLDPVVTAPVRHHRASTLEASSGRSTAEVLPLDVRWVLFGGKGGVGKSTCAAAWAVHTAAARPGRRFLLLSTDPAHSLGDVFGTRLSDVPAVVPGGPSNLAVREADAAAGLRAFREHYLASIGAVLGGATPLGTDRRALGDLLELAPPGLDEVMAIADVAELLDDADAPERAERYDAIVTDTAPTGHALRLLEAPALLHDWVLALMAILVKYQSVTPAGDLAALLVRLARRLRRVQQVLTDPRQAAFVVVTRPARLPTEETLRLRRSLDRLGIRLAAIVVNTAGVGRCGRCAAQAERQSREIDRLRRRSGAAAIMLAPAELPPPHGTTALSDWMGAWRPLEARS